MLRLLLAAALVSPCLASEPSSTRIERLENTFLAPCCYSEPVSRHRSETAARMKAEIARWVAEGKTDREIIDTYKQRYGAKVLVEPEGVSWWWMHVMPWVALTAGLAFTLWVIRRLRAAPAGRTAR